MVVFINTGTRMLAGHTRFALSTADWLSCLGIGVEFWEQSDEPYTQIIDSPIFGPVKVTTIPTKSEVKYQLKDVQLYYPLMCGFPIVLKSFPTSSVFGKIVFPEDLAERMRDEGFITGVEVFNDLDEDLRMSGTHLINYPNIKINKWKKIFANSHFTAERTFEKYGVRPQVFYPPVLNYFTPAEKKDIDFIIYSRLQKEKLPNVEEFVKSHKGKRIVAVGMDQGYAQVLKKLGVEVYADAPRNIVKWLLERSKNYVHLMTFVDDGKVYGEHFGISIAEAVYAGARPWIPDVPSGAKEIPNTKPYKSVEEITDDGPLSKDEIEKAVKMFDPRYRDPEEVLNLLP